MKISNFDKININNIILNKVKIKDDLKIVEIKYKNSDTNKKEQCIFKISNINTTSNILYNNIREYYIELLINNIDFYNFILSIEDHIKNIILIKSDKILNNFENINEYTIEELFKSNIKLSKTYNNPIIKFNIIKNIRNKNFNTLIYDRNKKIIDHEKIQPNQEISLIINLDKVIITNYTIEILFQIEQIKINKYDTNQTIKRTLNEYNFDTDNDDDENDNNNNDNDDNDDNDTDDNDNDDNDNDDGDDNDDNDDNHDEKNNNNNNNNNSNDDKNI